MRIKKTRGPKEMANDLKSGRLAAFSQQRFSDNYLEKVATEAGNTGDLGGIVKILIDQLCGDKACPREFEWNAGGLLQYVNPNDLFSCIPESGVERERLLGSRALATVLGELGIRDSRAINFLKDVVAAPKNFSSWFKAAHSLEKLGEVDAISYLKSSLRSQGTSSLNDCLNNLADYKNRIGVLLHVTVDNLQAKILPRVKAVMRGPNTDEKLGAAWIVGRFQYTDSDIKNALDSLVSSQDYRVKYYALQAIAELRSHSFLSCLLEYVTHEDKLLRKIAARGLGSLDDPKSLEALEKRLLDENDPGVLSAVTQALYDIRHYAHRRERELSQRIGANENGMIGDESDKWYLNPDIYHQFSEAQDPLHVCLRVALNGLPKKAFWDPVDIGSGTGKFASFLLRHLPLDERTIQGRVTCLDKTKEMVDFLTARLRREGIPDGRFVVRRMDTEEMADRIGDAKSDLVVASFSFPSKTTSAELALRELRAVSRVLRPDGLFLTVGWDETFNDELNEMWYKFVPDNIVSRNFEEWRCKRSALIKSPRNCGLTWYKTGLRVPVEFDSSEVAARVMGYLFGRSAAQEIVRTHQTRWSMRIGITLDRKERLDEILEDAQSKPPSV